MKLGMFTLKSDAVWVPPPNRPLFSTAERKPFPEVAPEGTIAGPPKSPSRQPVFEDEATLS